MKLRSPARLPLLLPALLAAACPETPGEDAGQKDTDAGTSTPDGGTPSDSGAPDDAGSGDDGDAGVLGGDGGAPEDGGSDPRPTYPNESCTSPGGVTPGETLSATTYQADDDHQGSCDFGGGGSDLVYAVTLDEPSGLVIHAEGYDMILYVTQGGCDAEDEVENGCVDDISDTEDLTFELLPAGTYNIVIDTYAGFGDEPGAPFSLDVDVYPGGYCTGDAFDPLDNTPATATYAGADDLDTQDLGDPSTPGPDPFEFVLCEGDVDYFLFGHMGGDLTLGVAELMASGTLGAELYEANLSVDEIGNVEILEGTKLADAPIDPAAEYPRGYYLLKVAGAGQGGLGDTYGLSVAHECRPDLGDDASPEFDDNDVSRVRLVLFDRPASPVERSLCGDDIDSLELEVRYGGNVTLTLGGGGALSYDVQQIVTADGVDALQAYPGAVTPQTVDGDLVLTMPGVPADTRLYVTVSLGAGAPLDSVPYTVDVLFGDPPANETCDSPVPLSAASDAAFTAGATLNGQDESIGPCGGEELAAAAGRPGAADVFYSFSLAQPLDTDILFNGALDPEYPERDFVGSVYLYVYPGFCPVDMSGLTLVTLPSAGEEPAPVCDFGTDFRLRIPALPADNYLLVVDGTYLPEDDFGPEVRTNGRFEIAVRSYPGGFPPPQVCVEAQPQMLPAPGAAVSFDVDTTAGSSELIGEDYGCFGYAAGGKERAIELTPSENLTVDIETSESFDTMLILREANCTAGTDLVCDDDGSDAPLASLLSDVQLNAGTTYYLFVEGYGEYAEGTTTVTITAAAAE